MLIASVIGIAVASIVIVLLLWCMRSPKDESFDIPEMFDNDADIEEPTLEERTTKIAVPLTAGLETKSPEQLALENNHHLFMETKRKLTHERKQSKDDMLLIKQFRGDSGKIVASTAATDDSAPGAIKRRRDKSLKVENPASLIGYNQHYKLPDKYYYEPEKSSLFQQITMKNGSNVMDTLDKTKDTNFFRMGTTPRVIEEMNKTLS